MLEVEEMETYCLVGADLQFYKMKRIPEMDGGDGCTAMRMYLMLPNLNTAKTEHLMVYFATTKNNKKGGKRKGRYKSKTKKTLLSNSLLLFNQPFSFLSKQIHCIHPNLPFLPQVLKFWLHIST